MNPKNAVFRSASVLLLALIGLLACGDSPRSGVSGAGDGGAADSGGVDDRRDDTGDDGSISIGIEAAADETSTPETGATDSGRRDMCLANCEAAHSSGASNASLNAGDCCGGACGSSCPSGACFGMGGIFGCPTCVSTCESCGLVPWKAGTCGANCRLNPDCKAYMDCLLACP